MSAGYQIFVARLSSDWGRISKFGLMAKLSRHRLRPYSLKCKGIAHTLVVSNDVMH